LALAWAGLSWLWVWFALACVGLALAWVCFA